MHELAPPGLKVEVGLSGSGAAPPIETMRCDDCGAHEMMQDRGTAGAALSILVDGWPTPAPECCDRCGRPIMPVLARALARFGLDADAAPLLWAGRMKGER